MKPKRKTGSTPAISEVYRHPSKAAWRRARAYARVGQIFKAIARAAGDVLRQLGREP